MLVPNLNPPTRRHFLKQLTLATAAVAWPARAQENSGRVTPRIKLGYDNFAVRAMKWKAPQLIDYAASLKTDSLFISDLDAFENLTDGYLKELRSKAADQGLQIHVGTWSICPTSKSFRDNRGTAEEHLVLGIRVARALGSPVIRVVLGSGDDRKGPGGIERHIAQTVEICRLCRSRAMDAGVKIAVENHAGDMQAWELAGLIEAAGKEYVGANIDSGNAAWAMEDPLQNLEILGPYVVTSSLRDSAIWEYEEGAKVQWTAMGEGQMDLPAYFKRFAILCPNVPVHIETISGFARPIPYLRPEFWDAYPKARAADFARFLALARKGKQPVARPNPEGKDKQESEQLAQKGEVERSIKYCKEVLQLGEKS